MTGQNMRRKSMWWHTHGKHAKIDPALYRQERRRRPVLTAWARSIRELFARRRP